MICGFVKFVWSKLFDRLWLIHQLAVLIFNIDWAVGAHWAWASFYTPEELRGLRDLSCKIIWLTCRHISCVLVPQQSCDHMKLSNLITIIVLSVTLHYWGIYSNYFLFSTLDINELIKNICIKTILSSSSSQQITENFCKHINQLLKTYYWTPNETYNVTKFIFSHATRK